MTECGFITLLQAHDYRARLDGATKTAVLIHSDGLVETVPLPRKVLPSMIWIEHKEHALERYEIVAEAYHLELPNAAPPEAEFNWPAIRVLSGLLVFEYSMTAIKGPVLVTGPRGLGLFPHEITAMQHLAANVVSRYTWWCVRERMLGRSSAQKRKRG